MRQYGLDFRFRRPGWRRWPWRRSRLATLCELLARFYPGFTFAECGVVGLEQFRFEFGVGRIPFMPGPEEREPEIPFSFVGPGCPQVLAQIGWVGQDPLGVSSLAGAGVPFGNASRPIRFGFNAGFIVQTRFVRSGVFDARRCNLGLSEEEGREVVAVWDALSFEDLQANGFT